MPITGEVAVGDPTDNLDQEEASILEPEVPTGGNEEVAGVQ